MASPPATGYSHSGCGWPKSATAAPNLNVAEELEDHGVLVELVEDLKGSRVFCLGRVLKVINVLTRCDKV